MDFVAGELTRQYFLKLLIKTLQKQYNNNNNNQALSH